MLIPTLLIFACGVAFGLALSAKDLRSLEKTIHLPDESSGAAAADDLVFNGMIETTCEFEQCYSAVVAGGRTNWQSNGANSDLANVYTPENDYDKWVQSVPMKTHTYSAEKTEGEFVYQMANSTMSCLTIMVQWDFLPLPNTDTSSKSPIYHCSAAPLAMNWDCHLDWGLTVDCSYNQTTNSIQAVYGITNMGPEAVSGEPAVVVVSRIDEQRPVVTRVTQIAPHL